MTTLVLVSFLFLFMESKKSLGPNSVNGFVHSRVGDTAMINFGHLPYCDSCALIGTAGTLLNSSLGQEIDNFQCIFRLGFSPVLGMEKDLGYKTTFRVVDAFRFYPFLKRPEKLIFGKYKSDHWYLFDKMPGDEIQFRKFFMNFLKTHGNGSLRWFTKDQEKSATQSLKKLGGETQYSLWNGQPAALWFTIKIIEDAGCPNLVIYGIPDPKVCKKNLDVDIRSKYWDNKSAPLCQNGADATSIENSHRIKTTSEVSSLLERRALKEWASMRKSVNFKQPSWPSRPEELRKNFFFHE